MAEGIHGATLSTCAYQGAVGARKTLGHSHHHVGMAVQRLTEIGVEFPIAEGTLGQIDQIGLNTVDNTSQRS